MTAINKQFTKLGETYTVVEQTLNGFICRNHEDHQLWVFTFEEVRRVLESQT